MFCPKSNFSSWFSKISIHWSESNVWAISTFSRPIALLTPGQIFLTICKVFCDWLPVSEVNLGGLLTAGVKVWLLEFSQLCRSKLNLYFFTGEHLASDLTSFNMAAWFANHQYLFSPNIHTTTICLVPTSYTTNLCLVQTSTSPLSVCAQHPHHHCLFGMLCYVMLCFFPSIIKL